MDNESKRQYISALIEHLESQKKYNLLFVTFGIAVIGFTLNKLTEPNQLFSLSNSQKFILAGAVLLIAVSSALYMVWHILLHNLRIQAIDWFYTLAVTEARQVHYPGNEFFRKWGWVSRSAAATMAAGLVAYIGVIVLRMLPIASSGWILGNHPRLLFVSLARNIVLIVLCVAIITARKNLRYIDQKK